MKAGGSRCRISASSLNRCNAPEDLRWAGSLVRAFALASQWAARASASALALPPQTCPIYTLFLFAFKIKSHFYPTPAQRGQDGTWRNFLLLGTSSEIAFSSAKPYNEPCLMNQNVN